MDEEKSNVQVLWQRGVLHPLLVEVMSEFGYLTIDLDEDGRPVRGVKPEPGKTVEVRSPWEDHENEGWRFRFEKPLLRKSVARYLAIEPDDVEDDQLDQMALEIAEVLAGRYLKRVDPECRWPLKSPRLLDQAGEPVPDEAVSFVHEDKAMAVWPEWSG